MVQVPRAMPKARIKRPRQWMSSRMESFTGSMVFVSVPPYRSDRPGKVRLLLSNVFEMWKTYYSAESGRKQMKR